ncbi:hypothetical protein PC9H_011807 [Pleurotus ostreatus]|uniref:Uncharacterized protein n=1 Tax=Pleurotus ostreatus TaxID=5322 RepID=A0A8H7DLT9_PLEOS|nr:uncharacterized protein PC9H_011807 [Pleurotus ostreatus]KAF7421285.1 hypothetical protein PC9H_011807 [Pleurotus ostreatus]
MAKRSKTSHTTLASRDIDQHREDEPTKRKTPKHQRQRMDVDNERESCKNGRPFKKLPKTKKKPQYVPYAPPFLLGPQENTANAVASTEHIILKEMIVNQGPLQTTLIQAQVNGFFSTELPDDLTNENPHWGMIPKQGTPPATTIPYTVVDMPRMVHKHSTLLGNMKAEVKDMLDSRRGTSILILPLGAGNKFVRENDRYAEKVLTFLKSLEFAGGQAVTVAPPTHQFEPPTKARFALPFAYIAGNVPPELRNFLLHRQTFAFKILGKEIAFQAVEPPQDAPRSWVIANYTGGCVSSDIGEMKKALGAIISSLFDDDAFTREVSKALAAKNVGQSVLERKVIMLSFLSLAFIHRSTDEVEHTPVWQLVGRPLYDNMKEHRLWLKKFRRTAFNIGDMKYLTSTQEVIGCVWCKAETHSSEDCPFPRLEDWKDPIPNHAFVKPEPLYRPEVGAKEREMKKKVKKDKAAKKRGKRAAQTGK